MATAMQRERPWSPEQDKQLAEMWNRRKMTSDEIAVATGRSKDSVTARVRRIRDAYSLERRGNPLGKNIYLERDGKCRTANRS